MPDLAEQILCRRAAHGVRLMADGGHADGAEGAVIAVVKAHDRHILRHALSRAQKRPDEVKRDLVIVADDRRAPAQLLLQKRLQHALVLQLYELMALKAGKPEEVLIQREKPRVAHCAHHAVIALRPLHIVGFENSGDFLMPVPDEMSGQQISTAAQQTVWRRMVERFGEVSAQTLCAATVEDIQACGTTFRKAEYVKDFAQKVQSGAFDLQAVARMGDDEVIAALSSLKGIGRWTAEMIMLFCLGRPDILSLDDLAIQRGMRMVYRHRAITPALFARYRRRLSPCGSTASLFFWEVSHGVIEGLTDPARPAKPKRKK